MWRRIFSSQLKSLATLSSSSASRSVSGPSRFGFNTFDGSSSVLPRHFSSADAAIRRTVEEVMPIATGHEREEIEAELQGKQLLDINYPEGPFGTKEAPAVVKSYYDKRIVGCPGGEGEDEHDVVWFWLEKGKPHECPVCTQYFVLEVVGPGGPPDGHGEDEDHH
ncbi:cytochrome c oxidase subunit 5b-1, mitochondrial-like [Neltuma alba]|uniref:cytochrome c oxidase subunit 5b-1, mitochondrial-like n=1 Tax=Neltuma alba TaxID=207710 RepID=UPI0010A407D3|nr:cytochrome c oxidase subunit 5b-1, mitochondrial-like [Prosopis alba]XP_028779113.1 cytochrome c oxidase subunit 5b-1, mitochondrial-like [Prosopis alba]